MSVDARKRLFTAEEFHRMSDAGIFGADDRLELLGGEIIEMVPIGASHAGCVKALAEWLIHALRGRATIGVQDPVRLDDLSEPVPDVSVLHHRDDYYRTAHPGPLDVHLLIEVADASTRLDRIRKVPRYAAAGIPELWVVDVTAAEVDVHRGPQEASYELVFRAGPGERISPAVFPDVDISVGRILGSPPAAP